MLGLSPFKMGTWTLASLGDLIYIGSFGIKWEGVDSLLHTMYLLLLTFLLHANTWEPWSSSLLLPCHNSRIELFGWTQVQPQFWRLWWHFLLLQLAYVARNFRIHIKLLFIYALLLQFNKNDVTWWPQLSTQEIIY